MYLRNMNKYVGVEELLSKPGAVSAKSYDFDNQETRQQLTIKEC